MIQPILNEDMHYVDLNVEDYVDALKDHSKLLFTTNRENPGFVASVFDGIDITMPKPKQNARRESFRVVSAGRQNASHSFHSHGSSYLLQLHGKKQWWFLPPTTPPVERTSACKYFEKRPPQSLTCLQHPGDLIFVPSQWLHATCMVDQWGVGVGVQLGRPSVEFVVTQSQLLNEPKFQERGWFAGNISSYYDKITDMERASYLQSKEYSVHRWLGKNRTTIVQHELVYSSILDSVTKNRFAESTRLSADSLQILDAGCGIGGALKYINERQPSWNMIGYTVSAKQLHFIKQIVKRSVNVTVRLQSFDELLETGYDAIFSIEALIHSHNISHTMEVWKTHLQSTGIIVLIDDFLSDHVDKSTMDVQLLQTLSIFEDAWLANSLMSPSVLQSTMKSIGLYLKTNRNIGKEYDVIRQNYGNRVSVLPNISEHRRYREHQGWLGAMARRTLYVKGVLEYRLMVFEKNTNNVRERRLQQILPQQMSGKGKHGGSQLQCLSPWYCCGKGGELWDKLNSSRTDYAKMLFLPRELYSDYMQRFAFYLNQFYANYSRTKRMLRGRFLDIGATGSTASGMSAVHSKFLHFAGPMEYWVLDADASIKSGPRQISCNIENCTDAKDAHFDVTFSHTVLEHVAHPWLAFDTIARITKKNGLTLHLVPWSYQWHATPEDHFRFSHQSLSRLLTERGFRTLEVGYDICSKPARMKNHKDEHFPLIHLTYIVSQKQ